MTARILIVDDELAILTAFQYALEDKPYQVVVVPTAQAGLMRFQEERFDVVVTDKNLPDYDGVWLLTKIRALDRSTQFVVITGMATGLSAIHAGNLGALEYLQKPFNDIIEVAEAIDRAMERSKVRPGDELIAYFDRWVTLAQGKTPAPDKGLSEPAAPRQSALVFAPMGQAWIAEILGNSAYQMIAATTPEAFRQKLAIEKSRTIVLVGTPEAVALVELIKSEYPRSRLFVVFPSMDFSCVRPFIVAGASGMISYLLGTPDAAEQLRRLLV